MVAIAATAISWLLARVVGSGHAALMSAHPTTPSQEAFDFLTMQAARVRGRFACYRTTASGGSTSLHSVARASAVARAVSWRWRTRLLRRFRPGERAGEACCFEAADVYIRSQDGPEYFFSFCRACDASLACKGTEKLGFSGDGGRGGSLIIRGLYSTNLMGSLFSGKSTHTPCRHVFWGFWRTFTTGV